MPNFERRGLLNAVGLACACLGILTAALIVHRGQRDREGLLVKVREEKSLRMRSSMEHLEDHMRSIWHCLQLVSLDPKISTMSPGPYEHLQAVYEATFASHGLTEIYVAKRTFTGDQHPFLSFYRELDGQLVVARHSLALELEEYSIHVEHIRRFAEDSSLQFLISNPINLCVGKPGVVCSVPVRSEGKLTGIVAGMVQSSEISAILGVNRAAGDELILVSDSVGLLGSGDLTSETRAWFQERSSEFGLQRFFAATPTSFQVGDKQAIWGVADLPGNEKWYVAYVYDQNAYMSPGILQSSWAMWAGAGTVFALGLLTLCLCRIVPTLAATRIQSDARAEELAESEACTRAIVETAADGIITIDQNGVIESFNAAAERIFGYLGQEVIGKRVNMLMPPPHSDRHDEYLQRYLNGGERQLSGSGRELEAQRRDGKIFPIELDVSEVNMPGRRLFTGMVRDISLRKKSEEALRESKDRYQTLVQNIDLGVTLMDSDHNILMVNEAQGRMFNKACHEFVGKKCYTEFEKCDQVCSHCPGTIAMATGEPAEAEREGVCDDRTRFLVRIRAFPIIGAKGENEGFIEVVEDITERRQSENLKRERQAELAHLARLSTLGEMTAGLAHELNQPLCAIVNYIEACTESIRRGNMSPIELIDDLQEAAGQAVRVGDIIEHLRHFASNSGSKWSTVNINQLIRGVLELMRHDFKQGCIEVEFEFDDDLPTLEADAIQIEQVFVNLLKNGIDAMVGFGSNTRRVTIATSMQREEQMVECSVLDTGPGLDAGVATRVFEAFYTTKANGMGVGLAIGRRIIESHGGRLWVETNRDRGAMFRFTLPIRPRRKEA